MHAALFRFLTVKYFENHVQGVWVLFQGTPCALILSLTFPGFFPPLNMVIRYPSVLTIPEAFLTRRIPYLELYSFPWLDLNQAREEIHANCRVRHLCKPPLCEAPDQTWFTNSGVTDDDQAKLVKPYCLHVYLWRSSKEFIAAHIQ